MPVYWHVALTGTCTLGPSPYYQRAIILALDRAAAMCNIDNSA
jgi:hypothetical protein